MSGNWNSESLSNANLPSNLFKLFEDVSFLTNEQIEYALGQPVVKLCDNSASGVWPLTFFDWTLDTISIDYPELYKIESGRLNTTIYPVETKNGTGVTKVYDRIDDVSIYYRDKLSHSMNRNSTGYLQIYGTYISENFNIANLNSLFESYDRYAININGRQSLFFYPIYSLGKDKVSSSRNNFENCDDCVRIETEDVTESAKYATFDCQYTNYMHDANLNDYITYWPDQGWQELVKKYTCYRISNFNVTSAMVEQNELSKINSLTSPAETQVGNLDYVQTAQMKMGSYMYSDICLNRLGWNGVKVYYFKDESGDLIDLCYKEGLYNIYIFTKEFFSDAPLGNVDCQYEDRESMIADIQFSNEEIGVIDSVLAENNINVSKVFRCQVNDMFILNSWTKNDARGYYIVVEEKTEIVNTSTYGTDLVEDPENPGNFIFKNEINFDYALNTSEGASNLFVTDGTVNFNLEEGYDMISSSTILKDLSNNFIKINYPSYYFTNKLREDDQEHYVHSIGYSNNFSPYKAPTYSYFFANGSSVLRAYQSNETLEFMYDAVMRSATERQKISVEIDSVTYTLQQLYEDVSKQDLYNSILLQLQNLYLLKVRETGDYRLCVCLHKSGEDVEFDVWATRTGGYIVTIYDPDDFDSQDVVLDINNRLISADWFLENYSYMSFINYDMYSNLLYGENQSGIGNNYVKFLLNSNFTIPVAMDELFTTQSGTDTISIFDLLEYYDTNNKCLMDIATGRYITFSNVQTSPFMVYKDNILVVVDKPIGVV